MSLRVFLTNPPSHGFDTGLEAALSGLDVHLHYGPELPVPADYTVLVGGRPTAAQLDASPALRHVIVPYVGIPQSTRTLLRERPQLTLHNLHHNAAPTAEMALTLYLAACKHLLPMDAALRRGDWRPRHAARGQLVTGRTALVCGFGQIGRHLARALRGLGMRVLGVRRATPATPDDPDCDALHGVAELPRLWSRAEALFVCVPETDDTVGLVDAAALAALPPGAVLVNVGRATVVEETALYDALRDGHLAAAGLDVWYRYPEGDHDRGETLPATAPLWELENVVLSPHRGGLTDGTERLRAEHLARLLAQAAAGQSLGNRVDLELGY